MVCPLYRDCPLLRDSNCIILIGGLKFGDLVLSIVERYLIQCPLFGVSVKRESTVLRTLDSSLIHLPDSDIFVAQQLYLSVCVKMNENQ